MNTSTVSNYIYWAPISLFALIFHPPPVSALFMSSSYLYFDFLITDDGFLNKNRL